MSEYEFYKRAGIFSSIRKPVASFFKKKYAPAVGLGLLGGAGIGLGISGLLSAPSKESVAAALVDFAIKAKPARYSGFTPAKRKKAISELMQNFNVDSSLYEKAKKAVNGLKRHKLI